MALPTNTIKILDTTADRYTFSSSSKFLGRMYDNDAQTVTVIFPEFEVANGSQCLMLVTYNNIQVDSIIVPNNTPINITSNLSQYSSVNVGFSFQKVDGYIKNSNMQKFYFSEAQQPNNFVPVEPEQKANYDGLLLYGFCRSEIDTATNDMVFYNVEDLEVGRINLAPFQQEQSDLAQTDTAVETFVKGKKTSNLENDGEDGSSPYATDLDVATAVSNHNVSETAHNDIREAVEDVVDGTTPVAEAKNVSDTIDNVLITEIFESDGKTAKKATNADNATNADSATNAVNATHADSATNSTNSTNDGSGNSISATYQTKANLTTAFGETLSDTKYPSEKLVKENLDGKENSLGFVPEDSANKNTNNGYCPLDSGGKVPLSNLPSTLLKYIGVWNASTNSPALTGTDTTKVGNVYTVGTAGTQFGIVWELGDWLIYNINGVAEKSDNSDDVVSVNGQTGIVVLNADNINDTDTTKKFATAEELTRIATILKYIEVWNAITVKNIFLPSLAGYSSNGNTYNYV
ncbi:MAG: hypothetical protein EOL95_11880, partial [Bacteroidia bacterium]|nr:hypothetical protein [Bacteroidia bacterium]